MTDTLPQLEEPFSQKQQARALATAGAVTFADLAWSHYWWEQERWGKEIDPDTQSAYLTKLRKFEGEVGDIVHAYWSTKQASAVAMTEQEPEVRRWNLLGALRLREDDRRVRLHRVTDWATRAEPDIAELLHYADLLAIRVGEVLRGVSQRIAMRWILGVEEHLLGFIERTGGNATDVERRRVVRSQFEELRKVEAYYHRAAGQAARIVYFGGMMLGAVVVALVGAVAAALIWAAGLFDTSYAPELGLLFLCFGCGAVGSLVSVMMRIKAKKFDVDYEVGRPLVRRLGVFRPAVGAIFGLALYVLLQSGLLLVEVRPQREIYYFAIAAFLAGFSERWTHVVLGGAQRTIAKKKDDEEED